MFGILVIITCIITLILLKVFLDINLKTIKGLKNRTSENLQTLSKKFPDDEKICNDILKELKNEDVKIKKEAEYESCLYTIFNNTITIGKFQQNYMKIQTIAHECIHSCQNKKTLWANFILTNIYLLYFVVILILEIANCLPYANIHILIFIFLSIIQYILRNSLENDAMIRAKYVAKDYIEKNKILDKNEEEELLAEYGEINNIGIPFMNFTLISGNIIKIIIVSLIALI